MARYYCDTRDLYIHCTQMMNNIYLKDNLNEYGVTEECYKDIIEKLLKSNNEWVLSATLLQDSLYYYFKPENDGVDLIFGYSHLQNIAYENLVKILVLLRERKCSTEDVYEMLKACITGVSPDDNGYSLSVEALNLVKNDMIDNAKLYLRDFVKHYPVKNDNRGILIEFNEHMPLHHLFKNENEFVNYLNKVDEKNKKFKHKTSCLMEIYTLVSNNNFKLTYVKTLGDNKNINQCDYKTYNLIFEGER